AQGAPQPSPVQHRLLGEQAPRRDPQGRDPAQAQPPAHAPRGARVPARDRPRPPGDEVATLLSVAQVWPSAFRFVVGLYWLYFASQKWQGIGWMKPVLDSAARVNPIPGLHEMLVSVVVPNWVPFALAQSIADTFNRVSFDAEGYGFPAHQRTLSRLIEDIRILGPAGVERAAQGWDRHARLHEASVHEAEKAALHAIEKADRGPAWDEVRRNL